MVLFHESTYIVIFPAWTTQSRMTMCDYNLVRDTFVWLIHAMKCLWIKMIFRYCSRRITSCVLLLQCAVLAYIIYNYKVRYSFSMIYKIQTEQGQTSSICVCALKLWILEIFNIFLEVLVFAKAVGLINTLEILSLFVHFQVLELEIKIIECHSGLLHAF